MRNVAYFVLSKCRDSIAFAHSSTLVIVTELGDRILLLTGSLLGV